MDSARPAPTRGTLRSMESDKASPFDLPDLLGGTNRAGALIVAGMSRSELRQSQWRRPWRGVVRLVGHDEEAVGTRVRDAVALLPAGCALGGWASLWWQGVPYIDGRDGPDRWLPIPLHMVSGHQLRRRPGVVPTRARIDEGEVRQVGGVLVSSPARAAFDHMRQVAHLVDAVIVGDMATGRLLGQQGHTGQGAAGRPGHIGPAATGERPGYAATTGHAAITASATTAAAIAEICARRPGLRGRAMVARALALTDDRSLSPWETRLRLFATEVLGVSQWCVNVPVFDRRGHLAGVVDLLDPTCGLALESDGAQHLRASARASDTARGETYADLRLTVVRVTAPDWTNRVRLRHRLLAGRRRALSVPVSDRMWTLDKPTWWCGSRVAQHWE